MKNGDYQFSSEQDNRFVGNAKDQFLVQLKQADLKASDKYQLLLDEIRHCAPGLKKLIVTGGEPFLDNFLEEVIESLPLASDTVILIYTGLGVAWSRFQKILDRIKSLPNLKLIVSAENTNKFLEFNRYGIDWPEFDRKIQYIKHSGIDFTFQPTITNLTVFGFLDFYKKYSDHFNLLSFAYQPRMMAVNVLDDQSKHNLEQQFSELPIKFRDELVRSMKALANDADRQKISEFLKQYVERRPDLDLGIYPLNFLQWLKLDHVVQ